MRSTKFIFYVVLFSTSINQLHAQFKITDTVYYNSLWQICEKPIASYYRSGVLATTNNVWFYSGKISDFTIDNVLLLDGEYAEDGGKEGKFTVYYPDGKIQASGNYHNNIMKGDWYWYYPEGTEKAIIRFIDGEQKFQFINYTDLDGNKTLQNGTGKFSWTSNPFDPAHSSFSIAGSFLSGNRNGEWRYFRAAGQYRGIIEQYSDEGKLKSINTDDYRSNKLSQQQWHFSPESLALIESIKYDDAFRINGDIDSLTLNNLAYYLVEHKPAEVDLNGIAFDTAFAIILRTLDQYRGHIGFTQYANLDFKIAFNIGATGVLENIRLSGTAPNETDKKYFKYLLGKFKGITVSKDINNGTTTNFTLYYNTFIRTQKTDKITYSYSDIFFSFLSRDKAKDLSENELIKLKSDRLNYHRYIGD